MKSKGGLTMNRKLAAALAVLILGNIKIKLDMDFNEGTYLSLTKALKNCEWAIVEGFIKILYGDVYNED